MLEECCGCNKECVRACVGGRKDGRKTHGGLSNVIECMSDSGSLPDELCAAVEVWEHLISSAAVMAS